jgi:hypothetical protein
MKDEQKYALKDIQLEYSKESDELIIALNSYGIEYLQYILVQLLDSEVASHWHIDDFDGRLGGDIKHLIIIKTD